jgi:hypothetical protein
VPTPVVSPTLPPQRIVFAATPMTLVLTANRPVVFALYALPLPTASPSAGASGAPIASGAPVASASPASPAPAPGSPTPAPTGS